MTVHELSQLVIECIWARPKPLQLLLILPLTLHIAYWHTRDILRCLARVLFLYYNNAKLTEPPYQASFHSYCHPSWSISYAVWLEPDIVHARDAIDKTVTKVNRRANVLIRQDLNGLVDSPLPQDLLGVVAVVDLHAKQT
jgi:hypothetical protein